MIQLDSSLDYLMHSLSLMKTQFVNLIYIFINHFIKKQNDFFNIHINVFTNRMNNSEILFRTIELSLFD